MHGANVDERLLYIPYKQEISAAGCASDQTVMREGEQEFYHRDHQGSIIAMTEVHDLTLSKTYSYDVFGKPGQAEDAQPFRYTGRRYDPETGLYYYRARYYHAGLGRFLQVDLKIYLVFASHLFHVLYINWEKEY